MKKTICTKCQYFGDLNLFELHNDKFNYGFSYGREVNPSTISPPPLLIFAFDANDEKFSKMPAGRREPIKK